MTQGKLGALIDNIVGNVDIDAVRRTVERTRDREIGIEESDPGMAEIWGRLHATDAQLVDRRLDGLAATVCDADPRTHAQRRADAMGVLAIGGDRLGCRCGATNCPAGGKAASGVVVNLVASSATLGGADRAARLVGYEQLIPAEVVAELAADAKVRPVIHPTDDSPECGYVPSAALARFVRTRDLTCRAPGCDVPAQDCDIDHTIPFAAGGHTHASNLKCLCRTHHLLKTFGGWRDRQLPDGTVIWTLPDGHVYVTTPGSALLFPTLCAPTGDLPEPDPQAINDRGNHAVLQMPRRKTTRAQNRERYVERERKATRDDREARRAAHLEEIRRVIGRSAARERPPPE